MAGDPARGGASGARPRDRRVRRRGAAARTAHPWIVQYSFDDELPTDEGWAKKNRHYWLRDYPGFAEWWFSQTTTEAHSTKAIEDAVGWAVDGSVEAMLAESEGGQILHDAAQVEATCRSVTCPMLIVHGTEDRCQPIARAHRLAELTGAPLVVVEGANHMIPGATRCWRTC